MEARMLYDDIWMRVNNAPTIAVSHIKAQQISTRFTVISDGYRRWSHKHKNLSKLVAATIQQETPQNTYENIEAVITSTHSVSGAAVRWWITTSQATKRGWLIAPTKRSVTARLHKKALEGVWRLCVLRIAATIMALLNRAVKPNIVLTTARMMNNPPSLICRRYNGHSVNWKQ